MSPPGRRSGPGDTTPQGRYNVAEITTTTDEATLPFGSDDEPQDPRSVKAAGIARAEAGTDDWWKDCCDRAIAALAATGLPFQAADLADLGLPDADHPNRMGARFLAAARRGVIEPIGYAPSKRPSTACSAVRVWRGTS